MKNSVIFIAGANHEKRIGGTLGEEAVKCGAKKVCTTMQNTAELDVADGEAIKCIVAQAGDTQILMMLEDL